MPRAAAMLFLLCFFPACSFYFPRSNQKNMATAKEIAGCIRDAECRQTFVVAHRGNGFGVPENSAEAARQAIRAGIPVIEVDVRYGSDYILYCLHDHSLDRTTDHSGNLKDLAPGETMRVRLKNSRELLPSFFDIYRETQGRAVLVVDFKSDAVEYLAHWISIFGSFNDVIFYVNNRAELKSVARMKTEYPDLIVMVGIKKWSDVRLVKSMFQRYPEIISIRFPLALHRDVAFLHERGVKFFVDSLVIPPPWQYIPLKFLLTAGIDFIQVDHPLFLKSIL